MMLAFVFIASFFFISKAHADLYCDPTIKARMEANQQNAINRQIAKFDNAYGQPNSFDSLYCGAQINSNFDSIANGLVSGLNGQIRGLLTSLFQKACTAALAPIQNLAAQACIPNFLGNFNLNLNGGNGPKVNYCNGMQLISVSPVISTPGFNGAGIPAYPALFR
ncbi:MAG: hypothetical protein EB059_04250 [Alphaproteobacteria bacterium]|nr:hypothetical protein [Alphaproteobacteria bacterium]